MAENEESLTAMLIDRDSEIASLRAELARKGKLAERAAEVAFCGGALTGMIRAVPTVEQAVNGIKYSPVTANEPMMNFIIAALAFAESEIPPVEVKP